MPEHTDTPGPNAMFGQNVQRVRERNGQTRAVVGGLIGRSAEWVKAIEKGRLGVPRLPLLLRLADVLGLRDLAELTGDERLTAVSYSKAAHTALPAVKEALTTYQFNGTDEEPETVDSLRARVRQAWQLWHGIGEHRTNVAAVLPDLLADLRHAARVHEGVGRRRVLVALAETYHLAQLYLSFQPVPELVMLTGDRAMTAAQDADSPRAIAVAAWYMNHVFRDAGERHEARVDLAMKAADLIRQGDTPEDLARRGLLQLAASLSYAKIGRKGDAERFWDQAESTAKRLGSGYAHPYLIFGQGMVDAYAITMNADLVRSGAAVESAEAVDVTPMPSATRRSFHMIESARAYSMQREPVAVVHLLKKAHEESPETARFNIFARSAVADLAETGPATVRGDARFLRQEMGLSVAA
ncbi:helix-turn-helix transcriptional regulator [Streptomyces sp. MK37H]|uniref:helix-turn-helix domain-containing protein n=1 Tax=Streptomyces sp. MK37H TaxID=2699117 RepID=UPI001B372042|nr:helix-turn-helix transcriptional regulator [Streptomyces sp. MK37H]MBP8532343.1 helix-turn-helix domain-containing protein [Streptomyces sp. MK37H]